MTVIALWSAPRSRSTVLFRSMAERGDLVMAHEPLFDILKAGRTDIGGRTFDCAASLLNWLKEPDASDGVFLKETTDHRYPSVLADRHFLSTARHAFLIRHPAEIAASYHARWPDLRLDEIGLENLHELLLAVDEAGGSEPVVIDSDDLVDRPAETLAAFCRAVDLPFLPRALSWEPGDLPEWAATSEWHTDVAASSTIERTDRVYDCTVENSPKLSRYAHHHLEFYRELQARRLRVSTIR